MLFRNYDCFSENTEALNKGKVKISEILIVWLSFLLFFKITDVGKLFKMNNTTSLVLFG